MSFITTGAPPGAKESETDAEFEARFNAALAASPKARAAWEEFQRGVAANGKRLTDALRRVGLEGEVTWRLMLTAWRSVGFSIEDFGRSVPDDLIEVLEAKANVLERIRGRGAPTSQLIKKKARLIGGRPQRPATDGQKLKKLRREAEMTQAHLAEKCGLETSTIQRGEGNCPLTRDNIELIAATLGAALNRNIAPEDLEK